MQPAVSVSTRGLLAAALAITATAAVAPPIEAIAVPLVPPSFDEHWGPANRLANVIAQMRWDEIDAAANAIDPASPYRTWMPAAIALAIEQIDATASAYANGGLCGELAEFRAHLAHDWPRGAASMRPVRCGCVETTPSREPDLRARFRPIDLVRVHPSAPEPR